MKLYDKRFLKFLLCIIVQIYGIYSNISIIFYHHHHH